MHQSANRLLPVVIPRMDPVMLAYLRYVQREAENARKALVAHIEMVRAITLPYYEEFGVLTGKIAAVKVRIRMLQKGAAATESLAAPQRVEAFEGKTEAEKYVLKKAYRQAAALCHPDKGGTTEEFQSVYNAYIAGDLYALNNFVLAREKPTMDMIRHWLLDAQRCAIAWIEFRDGTEFRIAQLVMKKQPEMARVLIDKQLNIELRLLLAQERALLIGNKEVAPAQL